MQAYCFLFLQIFQCPSSRWNIRSEVPEITGQVLENKTSHNDWYRQLLLSIELELDNANISLKTKAITNTYKEHAAYKLWQHWKYVRNNMELVVPNDCHGQPLSLSLSLVEIGVKERISATREIGSIFPILYIRK